MAGGEEAMADGEEAIADDGDPSRSNKYRDNQPASRGLARSSATAAPPWHDPAGTNQAATVSARTRSGVTPRLAHHARKLAKSLR